MVSLITKYDHIFFNESRISKLIDDYSQTSKYDETIKEKLDALGVLIYGYIVSRGYNMPNASPMSMFIIIPKELEPRLVQSVINDLVGEKHTAVISNSEGNTYISLY